MEISNFIDQLKDILEDTDTSALVPDCIYKDLDEWSSLMALSVIAMIDEEYDVIIKGDDIRNADTINDLFNIIALKQKTR